MIAPRFPFKQFLVTTTALLLCVMQGHAADTEPALISVWDNTAVLYSGLGYRDNVLLSSVATESSGYIYTGIDASLMRLTHADRLFLFYFLGEDFRYFDAPSVNYEQFFSMTARYSSPAGPKHTVGAEASYLYIHQVFDVSETQIDQQRVLVLGHSVKLLPYWKYEMADSWSAQLEAEAFRQIYEVELDDYWEGSGRADLCYHYGHRSELSLYYRLMHRFYDTLEQFDSSGAAIPGTNLRYQQNELGAEWKHYWDTNRRWRTRTLVSSMFNRDNGSGYFDYDRLKVREQLRWKNDTWTISGNFRASWYTYKQQRPAGSGGLLDRSLIELDLRAERYLTEHWLLHGIAEREWNFSNDPRDEYNSWTAYAGIGYDF